MIRTLSLALALVTLIPLLPAQDDARLLRYPHRQGDRIVFVKGGDVFAGTVSGKRAWRLTSLGDGLELFPRLSPDGQWVAFSGEYSGSRQIWIVPFSGGKPRQLTFYPDVGPMPPRGGYDNLPYDWTPDGKKILVRMNRTPYGQRVGRYFLVDPFGGGLEQPLSVPEGGAVSFSPDGKKLAYNVISREWRTWKRYRAGRAQDVWIYDLERDEARRITTWEGTDSQPLWLGERIYFVSDRSGTLNIWAHDLATGEERRITTFDDRDVTFPSRGQGGLVFECDGSIWAMAAGNEEIERLSFELIDDQPHLRPFWKEGTRLGAFDVSPEAREVVAEFRGDLFRLFGDGSEPRRIDTPSDRRERLPRWSPDGKYFAYLAENGDDYEVFLRDRKSDVERRLTSGSGAWILDLDFSPDGATLAVTDKAGRLRLVEVATGEVRAVDRGEFGAISQLAWSADSSRLAYVKGGANGLSSVFVVARGGGETRQVTGDEWSDSAPAFDPRGRYLWFVSARDFDYGELGFEQRVYGLLLQRDQVSPLEPVTKEEPLPKEEKPKEEGEKAAKEAEKEATEKEALVIDWDGLGAREIVLPLPSGRYGALQGEKNGILMRKGGDLALFDLESLEAKTVLEGVGSYRSAAREDKLAYASGGKLHICARKPGQKRGASPLETEGISVRIEPAGEWRQMFQDAWRIVRDWFYDPEMHQVDWLATRKRYEPLLDHMTHRSDLDYILGEMIAELNVGHAYVQGGEEPSVERRVSACLGCDLVAAEDGYRVGRIFAAENWTSAGRNPLRAPGVDLKEGDYILAIDGVPLALDDNPYRLLEGKVGRRVTLRVASSPMTDDARDVVIKPVASEGALRYIDWVAANRARVEERSGGRIGYIHVPNTSVEGHRRFYEGIRAYARTKEALIIDDRYNGGGFIPDRMAQVLTTKPLNYWARRSAELYPTPDLSYAGKSVMLINGYSSSGGDAFPWYYRELGGGPLIGTRTWGGLVGISFEPGLVDGGRIKVPSFAFVDAEGRWAVEAEGVAPDIEVVDDPGRIARGEHPILDRAIDHLLGELESERPTLRPPVPEGPDRAK